MLTEAKVTPGFSFAISLNFKRFLSLSSSPGTEEEADPPERDRERLRRDPRRERSRERRLRRLARSARWTAMISTRTASEYLTCSWIHLITSSLRK